MKILVVGGGSIGQRHACNAKDLGLEVALFDNQKSINEIFSKNHKTPLFSSLQEALAWGPVATIIAVPHHLHIAVARDVIAAQSIPLIEKPISHTTENVDQLCEYAKQVNIPIYVVCNLRFHQAIDNLKNHLNPVSYTHLTLPTT